MHSSVGLQLLFVWMRARGRGHTRLDKAVAPIVIHVDWVMG